MPVEIDVDMPENCRKCPFVSYTKSKRMVCRLTDGEFDESEGFFERFITCPLKEVKIMSDNEERIVIFNGVFNNNVDTTIYPDSGMTRAEALERMAKALQIYAENTGSAIEEQIIGFHSDKIAKTVLDVLLGGK